MSDDTAPLWQRAVRLLAARDRSEHDLRARLATAGAGRAEVDAIVTRLRARRYLDDRRFAGAAAERASRQGRGSDYVRAWLASHGVAGALIDDVVAATFTDETCLARRVLARRFGSEACTPAARGKAQRFLQQRGFPEAVVLAILGEGC